MARRTGRNCSMYRLHGVNIAIVERMTARRFSMSAFGTKRTSRPAQPMSAFGGKADIKLARPRLEPVKEKRAGARPDCGGASAEFLEARPPARHSDLRQHIAFALGRDRQRMLGKRAIYLRKVRGCRGGPCFSDHWNDQRLEAWAMPSRCCVRGSDRPKPILAAVHYDGAVRDRSTASTVVKRRDGHEATAAISSAAAPRHC